jgi:signal transduction histidine kinase
LFVFHAQDDGKVFTFVVRHLLDGVSEVLVGNIINHIDAIQRTINDEQVSDLTHLFFW